MINPLESYENQSGAVLSLKEWANSLNEQANPYPDSWQVLNKEDGEQILFCALREQGHIFGVWVDIEQILREVNRFYDNQYQHIFVNFKESGERQTSSAKSDENIAVTASFEKGNYAIEELTKLLVGCTDYYYSYPSGQLYVYELQKNRTVYSQSDFCNERNDGNG